VERGNVEKVKTASTGVASLAQERKGRGGSEGPGKPVEKQGGLFLSPWSGRSLHAMREEEGEGVGQQPGKKYGKKKKNKKGRAASQGGKVIAPTPAKLAFPSTDG